MVGFQCPRVPGIQVGEIRRHQRGIGQPCGFVVFGVAGDGAGLLDGGIQAFFAQVGGAGAALALAEIHGHTDATVTGGFHGLHRAHAHVDVQAALFAATDLGLGGAQRLGTVQQPLGKPGQRLQTDQAVIG